MTTIKKIDELIGKHYTIKIKSHTDVVEDNYEEGELEYVNSWSEDTITVNSTAEALEADIKQITLDYLQNTLYVSDKYLVESLKNYIDEDFFYYSKFVDIDNTTPSEEQVKSWRKGEEKMFVQNISISISVNGINLTMDILLDIFKEHTSADALLTHAS